MISIIVPIFNALDMTFECIAAIRKHTQDFELVVIDNGSDPAFKPPFMGYADITVIRNEENKGFPVAVNQGIGAAKGDIIVLLNNDVIVTPLWAEKLKAALDEFSIVGPVTNYCAGMQRAEIGVYENIDELDKEAEQWAEENQGTIEEVNFLIGFCMAFKKSLYDEIGPFDESLWPCSGEEIDFCFKAREKGHKIGIIHDVYVHHEGSKTFTAMMSDSGYEAICKRNDAHLAKKWGDWFWNKQAISKTKREPVTIGKYSYVDGDLDVSFIENANLTVGKFCSIAKGCKVILGGNHRGDWISTFPFPAAFPDSPDIPDYQVSKGDVVIGNDVWIGYGVTILSGVTIGDGAIIGAGSVVIEDVIPYTLVAGNPTKVKKYRFEMGVINKLLELKWWDWPEDEIRKAIPILMSGDIEKLFSLIDGKAAA